MRTRYGGVAVAARCGAQPRAGRYLRRRCGCANEPRSNRCGEVVGIPGHGGLTMGTRAGSGVRRLSEGALADRVPGIPGDFTQSTGSSTTWTGQRTDPTTWLDAQRTGPDRGSSHAAQTPRPRSCRASSTNLAGSQHSPHWARSALQISPSVASTRAAASMRGIRLPCYAPRELPPNHRRVGDDVRRSASSFAASSTS